MDVLFAVVDDLLLFAREALFGTRPAMRDKKQAPSAYGIDQTAVSTFVHALQTYTPPATPTPVSSAVSLHTGEQYYIGGVDVYMYTDPVVAFDNALCRLPYAQGVRLLRLQGRWAQVRFSDTVGWILKDSLSTSAANVLPQLTSGEQYDAAHPETKKLRACIEDEFHAGRNGFSLTAEEYVTYRLVRRHKRIPWRMQRSRLAGTWQRKLKGTKGVYMHVQPKTDSVMEYVLDDVGYLAFVEAVYPDNSIKIAQVYTDDNARYEERTLSVEDYREYTPVFIAVL